MVGKSQEKFNSHIFHQCYVKCCRLQHLTPLNDVLPSGDGSQLDFCVDRIKYADWAPILNALCTDLSLRSVSIRCRQHVKTVLEHIDCERLAKTVQKRAVLLTNFMFSNLMEALSQLLTDSVLLSTLLLEGLPIKIPYLDRLLEGISKNTSLHQLYLPRCLIGDAGCLALCKAIRNLPNILVLDLSGCEITSTGAGYIADLIKYQKIHRYSENWVHTLRYQLPELDTMAGLRRITLCGNALGDVGASQLLEILADDLWIKAVDLQNCDLTNASVETTERILQYNTTLVVLDVRNNGLCRDGLSRIRAVLKRNAANLPKEVSYSWIDGMGMMESCSESRLTRSRHVPSRDPSTGKNAPKRSLATKTAATTKRDSKFVAEELEAQLRQEIAQRRQLEEMNLKLLNQIKQMKQHHPYKMWPTAAFSEGSEASLPESSNTSSSESCRSVPIDHNTLSYIQHAFQDIYTFIKENQCQCSQQAESREVSPKEKKQDTPEKPQMSEIEEYNCGFRLEFSPKPKRHQIKIRDFGKKHKTTKSSHTIGKSSFAKDNRKGKITKSEHTIFDTPRNSQKARTVAQQIIEANMGDNVEARVGDMELEDMKAKGNDDEITTLPRLSASSSAVSDNSDTLVEVSQRTAVAINPLEALDSSSSSDDEND